ncbi:MAG: hypothetical protein LBO07_03040 [Coriobacteriales bacterium]|jgi:putative effector of murein hydrolase LrgA (UPF0299 family)|nr:hypothetical protein [Coriobacteriales bacterium]
MLGLILLFVPLVISVVGGALITDENAGKRTAGFVIVVIATLGVIAQIAWQIVDPTYYLPAA